MVVSGANFCVGQNVPFQLETPPPGVTATNFRWTLQGSYVNDHTNAVPGGSPPASSENYFKNSNLLANPVLTNCWWVSGGFNPPQTYQVSVTCTLVFTNGNPPQPNDAKGLFTMLRPLPSFWATVRGYSGSCTNHYVNGTLTGKTYLYFGINHDSSNVGIAFVYTNAPLDPNTTSSTYGQYFLTQVVESFRQQYNVRNPNCVGYQAEDQNGLDAGTPYQGTTGRDHCEWTDAPDAVLSYASWLTQAESFRSTLMFQPDCSGSISVPMYKVDWNWSGTARTNGPANSWVLVSGSPPVNPQPLLTEQFPTWTHTITNLDTTSASPTNCFNEN